MAELSEEPQPEVAMIGQE
jgi:monomeric isocitrate dehydrogenase